MTLFLLCAGLPAFAGGPLALLAAAALHVKGYGAGARLVGLGMVCIVTSWGALLLVPLLGVSSPALVVSASLALVGNAVACEGAARAGDPPAVPPGLIYMAGLGLGGGVPCLVSLMSPSSGIVMVGMALWVVVAFTWLFAAGGAMAAVQAIRLPRVGGYDDLD